MLEKIIFKSILSEISARKASLYIFSKKNVTLHFSIYRKFLLNGTLLRAEIFTTYRTSYFVSIIKISIKLNNPFWIYSMHNFQNVTLQSEYNSFFFKSSPIFWSEIKWISKNFLHQFLR
jgi:hypothetical protein